MREERGRMSLMANVAPGRVGESEKESAEVIMSQCGLTLGAKERFTCVVSMSALICSTVRTGQKQD